MRLKPRHEAAYIPVYEEPAPTRVGLRITELVPVESPPEPEPAGAMAAAASSGAGTPPAAIPLTGLAGIAGLSGIAPGAMLYVPGYKPLGSLMTPASIAEIVATARAAPSAKPVEAKAGPVKDPVTGDSAKDDKKKGVTLASVTKNMGLGVGMGGSTMSLIPLAKHTTQAQLAGHLNDYGFTATSSDHIAKSALDFAHSNAGHITGIFVAGTAVGLGAMEAFAPDASWIHKITGGLIVGAVLAGLFVLLIYLGVFGEESDKEKKAAPAPTAASPAAPEPSKATTASPASAPPANSGEKATSPARP